MLLLLLLGGGNGTIRIGKYECKERYCFCHVKVIQYYTY